MYALKTVRVVNPNDDGACMIINECDKTDEHVLFDQADESSPLTVIQIKSAMADAGIPYVANTKKADLLAALNAGK